MIKANSSKWANDAKSKIANSRWQEGYAAFTVSESQVATTFGEYIRNQEEHHRKQTYQENSSRLLSGMALNTIRDICGIDVAPSGL